VREASLLKELRHANILHLESVYVNNSAAEFALSLVFEFVDHDLHEMMQVRMQPFAPWWQCASVAKCHHSHGAGSKGLHKSVQAAARGIFPL
jgi:serine/threonine protein kinase